LKSKIRGCAKENAGVVLLWLPFLKKNSEGVRLKKAADSSANEKSNKTIKITNGVARLSLWSKCLPLLSSREVAARWASCQLDLGFFSHGGSHHCLDVLPAAST